MVLRATFALIGLFACGSARAQQPAEVPVRFEPDDAADCYRVTIEGKACTTPCALSLRPGAAPLAIDGGRRRDSTIVDLPAHTSTVRLTFSSRANYLSGALALALGAAATGTGVSFAAGSDWNGHLPVGIVAAALGVTGLIVGIVDLARAGRIHARVN